MRKSREGIWQRTLETTTAQQGGHRHLRRKFLVTLPPRCAFYFTVVAPIRFLLHAVVRPVLLRHA
eukprot:3334801-Pyramimonas_sp.AAC.1